MALFVFHETTADGNTVSKPWPWTYWMALIACLAILGGVAFAAWVAVDSYQGSTGGGQIQPPPQIENPAVIPPTETHTTTQPVVEPTTEPTETIPPEITEPTVAEPEPVGKTDNSDLTLSFLKDSAVVGAKMIGEYKGVVRAATHLSEITKIEGQTITLSYGGKTLSIYIAPEVLIVQTKEGAQVEIKDSPMNGWESYIWYHNEQISFEGLQVGDKVQVYMWVRSDKSICVDSVQKRTIF